MKRLVSLLMLPVVAVALSLTIPTASGQEQKEGEKKESKKKGGKKKKEEKKAEEKK